MAANISEPPLDTVAVAGGSAQFQCTAFGQDRPNVTWYSGESILTNSSDFQIIQNLRASTVITYLTIVRVNLDLDGTTYTCVAANSLGDDSASATLSVLCKFIN